MNVERAFVVGVSAVVCDDALRVQLLDYCGEPAQLVAMIDERRLHNEQQERRDERALEQTTEPLSVHASASKSTDATCSEILRPKFAASTCCGWTVEASNPAR